MTNRKIVALAAFAYVFLAPFFFHPDLKVIFYQAQFLTKGVINIYQFLEANPQNALLGPFVYPPLAYFFVGVLFPIVNFIAGPGFTQWLAMGNDAVTVPHIFRYIFALKLPFILFHFMSGFYLSRWFVETKKQRNFLLLWFFNPISLYVVALMGQIDVVAVFLTIVAIEFAHKKPTLSAALLGLGAAIKTYPLLLIPFLAFGVEKSWQKRLKLLLIAMGSYLVFVVPYLTTPAFYSDTLTSGLSQRLLLTGVNIGYGETLVLVPLLIILVFIAFLKSVSSKGKLIGYFFVVTSLVVVLTHFHPQWGMWYLPFFLFLLIKMQSLSTDQKWLLGFLFFIGFLATVVLYNDLFLSLGLVSPIDSGVLFLSTPSAIVQKFFESLIIQSLFHSALASGVFWLSYKVLSDKNI